MLKIVPFDIYFYCKTGLSTEITIDHNATWNHYFSVWALDSNDQAQVYMTVAVAGWNYVSLPAI